MNPEDFTPIQRRMLEVLADGKDHSKQELHACLADDLGPLRNICAHITGMRKVLRRHGQDVVCVALGVGRKIAYRHVRLLASAVDGKR